MTEQSNLAMICVADSFASRNSNAAVMTLSGFAEPLHQSS